MLRVLAVTLPDHVNAACYAAQDELFLRFGLVSTRALPPLIPLLWLPVSGTLTVRPTAAPPSRLAAAPSRQALSDAFEAFTLQPFTLGPLQSTCSSDSTSADITDAYASEVNPVSAMTLIRDRLKKLTPAWQSAATAFFPLPLERLFLGLRETPDLPELPLGRSPLWNRPISTATVELIEIDLEMTADMPLEAAAHAEDQCPVRVTRIAQTAWRTVAECKLKGPR